MKKTMLQNQPETTEMESEIPSGGESMAETESEGGNAVYDMFCALEPDEQKEVFARIQTKLNGDDKKPMSPKDDREFRSIAKEEY